MNSVADLYGFNFQKEIRKLVFEFFLSTFGETCETENSRFPGQSERAGSLSAKQRIRLGPAAQVYP